MIRRPGFRRSRVVSGLAALVAVTVSACTGASGGRQSSSASPSSVSSSSAPASSAPSSASAGPIIDVTVAGTIATGLTTPWGLDFLPDGTALVTERDTGTLLAISPDAGHAVSTVGTVNGVAPGGEGGLLGLAVSPAPGDAPTVFVYYTADGDNRVAALTLRAGAGGRPLRIEGQ
jgi:glucose/arabinose dehydrogenase